MTYSAGLSASGILPIVPIYSTFMQRAYDQLIHDVALQNLNVVFCLDRGGLVGADGATHHGAYDIAYLRCIPNMVVAAPMNEQELRNMMYTAQLPKKGPFSIRYPRGNGVMTNWQTPFEEIKIGNTPQSSVFIGYEKAFVTILDANITTLLVALVLFGFGTGPVKGFAITLSIGILVSLFTAIWGTRMLVNWMYGNRHIEKLSI